ncbi:MAG TPA: hypothetical protein VFA33_10840 [Bryobacteraceae bacterium]|nr:hypothetical protein [Bryobacteraceae bacterium]
MIRRSWVILGALLFWAGGAALPAWDGGATREFHQTYALSAHGRVSVDNVNGSVRILGWDRDEVRVDAVGSAVSQERLERARILVEAQPQAVRIRTQYDESSLEDNPASVEYTVTVPRTASLDAITLINGAVEISGVRGDVRASSVNGAVRARELAGEARLSTVNGSLVVVFESLDPAKTVALHSVNGNIVLSIPFDAHAELSASNVTGGILNEFGLQVNRGGFVGNRMCGALKGGGTRIRLNNVNGSISILPVAAGRRVRFT